jgi:hypothetical protein
VSSSLGQLPDRIISEGGEAAWLGGSGELPGVAAGGGRGEPPKPPGGMVPGERGSGAGKTGARRGSGGSGGGKEGGRAAVGLWGGAAVADMPWAG